MYAFLPILLAPIVVENIRFNGSAKSQSDFLQEGQDTLFDFNSLSRDLASNESGLGWNPSKR